MRKIQFLNRCEFLPLPSDNLAAEGPIDWLVIHIICTYENLYSPVIVDNSSVNYIQ